MKFIRLGFVAALLFGGTVLCAQSVVISEIYGGGGNSGAIYKNDFIELYNPTSVAIDLTGWSVQYISGTGTGAWQKTNLSGTIAPRGYYLVQEAVGTGGTSNLPTPDATGTIAMAATAGKVALVSNSTALSGASPVSASIVDLVGFGTANFYEGTGAAPAPSNTNSIERKANAASTAASMQAGGADQFLGNGFDSNVNSADFVTRTPEPQNSLNIAEPDVIPPTFTSSFPQASNISSTSFDLVVNVNEPGKVYFVVLADGATAPTAAQVKAGQDSHGSQIANSGFISISSIGTSFSSTVLGLSSSTNYDVYIVAQDIASNLQASPILVNILTDVGPSINISPVFLTFPGFTQNSKMSQALSYSISISNFIGSVSLSVSGNFLISSDDAGYLKNIVITSITPLPFAQTIYVKFDPSGATGTIAGAVTHSVSGMILPDVILSATSIDPFSQNFNDPLFLSNSGWSQYSVTGAQVWTSTNFGHTCLTGCNNSTTDKAAQINGYSGSPKNNEDWLISPQLDLTAFVNYPALSFATISAFAGDALQLKYSTNYSGSGDPSVANWVSINGKFPQSNSSAWTTSSNIILPKAVIYIAFVYTSNTTSASRWTLDDWKVEDLPAYINVSQSSLSFGEAVVGSSSPSQGFTMDANGYGNITVSVPGSFEVSLDNNAFTPSVLVTQAEASVGKKIYVRFTPSIKQLKWSGAINFTGTGLNISSGSLTGSSYPKSETFNIATYNMEFFGTDIKDASNFEFGPTDDALQVANVSTVLQSIAADIFAVEEISDDTAFNHLVSNLPGYDKVVSNRWSYSWQAPDPNFPPQKIGFIYKTAAATLVGSRTMFASMYDSIIAGTKNLPSYPTGTSSSFWSSGRLPFMATFDVSIAGIKRRIRVIDIHGKSASDQESYNRRVYDSKVLHDSLNAYYPHDNIILIGDFNDQVYGSITVGAASSYKVFVDDADHFKAITYDLNVSGATTFPSSSSFIDNIIVSDELMNAFVANSATIEDPRSYINNYSSTTSDHLPVWSRFLLSSKADQTLTFNAVSPKVYGDPKFVLSTSASSGLDVLYTSSDPSVVSVNGNVATIVHAGVVMITASQTGNEDFKPTSADQSFIVSKAEQNISIDELPAKVFGDAPFEISSSSSSNLPVSYSSSDPSIASIDGSVVTIVRAGSVTITASQSGNDDFNETSIARPMIINRAEQIISFDELTAKVFGDTPFEISSSSSSNLPVIYSSSDPSIAFITGNTLTIIMAGSVTITASQPGDANYNAAEDETQVLTINKASQTITFGPITAKTLGEKSFTLSASSSSGLSVAFLSSSDKVAIAGAQVEMLKSGRTFVRARQAGNKNYDSAKFVDQSFCINPARPVITVDRTNPATVTLTSSASSGNQWYFNGGAAPSATNATLVVTSPGNYKVQAHTDDCFSEFSLEADVVITDIGETASAITLYPNPVEDYLYIAGGGKGNSVVVYDVTGRSIFIFTETYNDGYRISMSGLSSGFYIAKIIDGNVERSIKFVKK